MSDQFAEQFKILQRAKKLEQMGSEDRALDLYLELHEKHTPNTSDSYERPIIILERKRRYEEAMELCNKAIKLIDDDKISGTKDKFTRHIQIIENKLKDKPIQKNDVNKQYGFGIVGFRSKSKIKIFTSIIFYLLFICAGLLLKSIFVTLFFIGLIHAATYFADVVQVKTNKRTKSFLFILLLVSLSVTVFSFAQIPDAFNRAFDLTPSEEQHSLGGGDNIFKTDETLPEISESNIDDAIKEAMKHVEVNDALIIANGASITFGLLLDPTTKEKRAIDIAEDFVDALSHFVANDQDLKRPTSSNHGELYEYYNILISAGSDDTKIIIKGKKNKNSKFIIWIE